MLKHLQEYKKLKFFKTNNIGFYFEAFVITVALFVTLALVVDLLQIHVYAHDSVLYEDSFDYKLKSEGRWLNYLLFPVTSHFPGRVAVLSNLLFLSLFVFLVSKRWTGRASYSILLALLVIQAEPLMEALLWPATSIGLPILFLAALVSPFINVYLFYILFGVLLFGGGAFYLLPLAHLQLFRNGQLGQNIKILSFKILPGWALGFLAGLIVSLVMVYALTGQVGLQVQAWRQPNYIHSLDDLIANTINAFDSLQFYLPRLFYDFWRKFFMVAALLIGFYRINKAEYVPAAILAFGIIVVHFILTIPTGITVSFRTTIVAWIGVLVIFFFYPNIKERQYFLLLPVVLFMMASFYRVNHYTLSYYSSITNTYYDELVRVTPLPPRLYRGLIFLSSSAEVMQMNAFLIKKLQLKRGIMESINEDFTWRAVAREAGFKKVTLCGKNRHENSAVCKSLYEDYRISQPTKLHHSGLYKVHGQKWGFLIVSLNSDLDLSNLLE